MKTVLFRGPALTQSGYAVHARQVIRWLLTKNDIKLSIQALSWGDTPWLLNSQAKDGFIGKIMSMTNAQPGTVYDVTFQLQLPNEWDPSLGKFNVGMTAAVETDRCNPEWCVACNKMNLIIVPSEHAKLNLTNSGQITTPITVIPEAFSDAVKKPTSELPMNAIPNFSTPFNFLVFGQLTGNNPHNDRKNTFFTLKWLFEEFKDDPNVGVVLKTNRGRNSLIDRMETTNILQQVVRDSRKGTFPKLHLIHGEMTDDEVAGLYRHESLKALVSLTRGEGYGLPTLEAASSGLPIIATGWSGHLDYLKLGKFINVAYTVTDVHPTRIDNKIFVKGSRWANPSEDDFKKKIRKFYTSNSIPKEWAIDLQQKLIKVYSFDEIAKRYDEALKDVV